MKDDEEEKLIAREAYGFFFDGGWERFGFV